MRTCNLFLLGILLFASCETDNAPSDNYFSIRDANGALVAEQARIDQWTKEVVSEKFGDVKFEVERVETTYKDASYAAVVKYKAGDVTGSYVIMSSPGGFAGRTGCDHVRLSCSGNSCCQVMTDMNSGIFKCACSGQASGTICAMNVECVTSD